MELSNDLQKLRQSDPDIDYIMKVFEEADRVNREAEIAMGQREVATSSPVASTMVAVTFQPDISTGDQSPSWKQ